MVRATGAEAGKLLGEFRRVLGSALLSTFLKNFSGLAVPSCRPVLPSCEQFVDIWWTTTFGGVQPQGTQPPPQRPVMACQGLQ